MIYYVWQRKLFTLRLLIKSFLYKNGAQVFLSALYSKLVSFVISLLLIRFLPQSEFGHLSYSLSLLAFFIPFSGGGLQYSFLKFAPAISSNSQRDSLYKKSRSVGLCINIVLLLLIITFSFIGDFAANRAYTNLLAFYVFGYFLIEMLKSRYRVYNLNNKFALVDVYIFTALLVLGVCFSYFYGAMAYIIAFIVVPIIIYFLFNKRVSVSQTTFPNGYLKYGLWVGIGAIASQLMYSLDIFLIGQFVQDAQMIAIYKSASIIPLALFFIPNSYITTYYTDIALHDRNKSFLVKFIRSYLSLFSIISLLIASTLIVFSDLIIFLLFGEEYMLAVDLFNILIIGMIGAFMLRIPFGNALAAVGKSKWNALVAGLMLLLNAILNYWAIRKWGVYGAAYVTSGLLWVSGIVSAILFWYYLRELSSKEA